MAFDSPPRVLYVCHGNILRSAFAMAVDREVGGTARSAGLHAIEGHSADETGQRIAAAMGIDLSRHRATPVSEELVSWADLIVAMDRSNQAELHVRFPHARPRVRLLGMLRPGGPLEVPDPYGIGEDAVRAAFELVRGGVLGLHSATGLSKDRAQSP